MNAILPTGSAAAVAAALVRCPLRWGGVDDGPCDPAEGANRGWFHSVQECARHLAALTTSPISTTRAFGVNWPCLGDNEWLVAPAVPLVLTAAGEVGVDAAYSRREGVVYREAAGLEEAFLTTDAEEEGPGRPFDLLWFGDSERFTVREGTLEVEDLFARLALPTDRHLLERLLVRGRRVDAKVLDGIPFEPKVAPATLTVHRAAALHEGDRWRDPVRFFRARADIEGAESRSGRTEVRTVDGAQAAFACEEQEDGWRVVLQSGDYQMTGFSMHRHDEALSLTATLHPSVDPLAPGMRGRLAFDLRSDLVAIG